MTNTKDKKVADRKTRHERPCVDCKWHKPPDHGYLRHCRNRKTTYQDIVIGGFLKGLEEIRADVENCGPGGVFWEKKAEKAKLKDGFWKRMFRQ